MNTRLTECQQKYCSTAMKATLKEQEKTKIRMNQIIGEMKQLLGKMKDEKDENKIANYRKKLEKYKAEIQRVGNKNMESKTFKKVTSCSIKKCGPLYNETLLSISHILQRLCEDNKVQACEMFKKIKEINKKVEKKDASDKVIEDIVDIIRKLPMLK